MIENNAKEDYGDLAVKIGSQTIHWGHLDKTIRALSEINPWRSLWFISSQWFVIIAAIAGAIAAQHWAVYGLAIVIIATRQFALGVLMHDAAHFRLFKNKFINDFVSEFFLAFPLGISTKIYRHSHILHHKYLNTTDDPDYVGVLPPDDWKWPKTRGALLMILLRDLISLNGISLLLMDQSSPWPALLGLRKGLRLSRKVYALLLGWTAAVILFLSVTQSWFLFFILWILPILTVLNVIVRIRAIAAHQGVENTTELNASRDVAPSFFERLFLSPFNVHYHLTHHLFPSVPWYNLGKLHQCLIRDQLFKAEAHISTGYLGFRKGVLAEVTREPVGVRA